jgi:acetylornithine/succinyldiaminopimelate/putrescine aminotransferase
VSAAALETLKIDGFEEKIVDRARETGIYFKAALETAQSGTLALSTCGARGLLLGIQLDGPADGLVPVVCKRGFWSIVSRAIPCVSCRL